MLHGDAPVRLILHEGADLIVVVVHDGGSVDPVMGNGPTDGLRIVDELTHGAWGISLHRRHGKWVWAVLPAPMPRRFHRNHRSNTSFHSEGRRTAGPLEDALSEYNAGDPRR